MKLHVELYQERMSMFGKCLEPLSVTQSFQMPLSGTQSFQNANLCTPCKSIIPTHCLSLVVKINLLIRPEMSLLNYGEVNETLPLVHFK